MATMGFQYTVWLMYFLCNLATMVKMSYLDVSKKIFYDTHTHWFFLLLTIIMDLASVIYILLEINYRIGH
jgi:hypothetical protein